MYIRKILFIALVGVLFHSSWTLISNSGGHNIISNELSVLVSEPVDYKFGDLKMRQSEDDNLVSTINSRAVDRNINIHEDGYLSSVSNIENLAVEVLKESSIDPICDEIYEMDFDDQLLLAIDFDGAIVDDSENEINILNENVVISSDRFTELSAGQFGEDQTLNLGNDEILKPDFPFSFSFWVFPEELGIDRNYIYTSDLQLDNRAGFAIQTLATDNRIHFFYSDESGCYNPACRRGKIADTAIPIGEWTHVVINVADYDDVDIYYDGCIVPSTANGTGNTEINYSNEPSYIGFADNDQQPGERRAYFGGKIDDFFFWNRTISEEEVLFLFDRFEVPEMDLATQYIIPLVPGEVEVSVDDQFSQVVWSNGLEGNTASFDEEGVYQVEGLFDCHLVCAEFTVIRDQYVSTDNPTTKADFTIYPNPTVGQVRIDNLSNVRSLTVTDVNGRLVLSTDRVPQSTANLDLSNLENGVYYVTVISDGGTATKRIIKVF